MFLNPNWITNQKKTLNNQPIKKLNYLNLIYLMISPTKSVGNQYLELLYHRFCTQKIPSLPDPPFNVMSSLWVPDSTTRPSALTRITSQPTWQVGWEIGILTTVYDNPYILGGIISYVTLNNQGLFHCSSDDLEGNFSDQKPLLFWF